MFPAIRSVFTSNAHGKPVSGAFGLTSTEVSSGTATASLYFDADGGRRKFTESSGSDSTVDITAWWSRADVTAVGADWEVKLVKATGIDRRVDALGDGWLTIDSTRLYSMGWAPGAGPQGPDVSTYTYDIGMVGTSTSIVTGTITVTLSIDSP